MQLLAEIYCGVQLLLKGAVMEQVVSSAMWVCLWEQTVKTNYEEFCFIYQGFIILRQLSCQLASSVCVANTLRGDSTHSVCFCSTLPHGFYERHAFNHLLRLQALCLQLLYPRACTVKQFTSLVNHQVRTTQHHFWYLYQCVSTNFSTVAFSIHV